jgi:hypothetical protein
MTKMTGESFIDIDFAQRCKTGQRVSGDVFLTQKIKEEGRVIAVLSDGLGSGIKASVLANMTAVMALKYAAAFVDVRKSSQTIMDTLPICEIRKISYSTFTIVDIDDDGTTRLIEHGNPPALVMRGERELPFEKTEIRLPEWQNRLITCAQFRLQLGDRVVFFTDGVTQSGMEQRDMPTGWGQNAVYSCVREMIRSAPDVSAGKIAVALVDSAWANDRRIAKDDISCAAIGLRCPRRLLVASGPPFSRERDAELAHIVDTYPGHKVICGGTTAGIVARQLGRQVEMNLTDMDPQVPPESSMQGVDMVTEGTLTLAKVAEHLEDPAFVPPVERGRNAAIRLVQLMLECDIVEFVVGTRINEAHQDPNLPMELDLRRNIVRRIASALEKRHLQETSIRFL